MRFMSLRLKNYIGIYNGMGLDEIFIDFSKCQNRTIIIRGDNGSGKSTLMGALQVLPETNESFIPNLTATKELYLSDSNILYRIYFLHAVKTNGERDTTKAYFSKCIDGITYTELNENGNVTSFKDILYSELKLDSNFIALSQLSSEDRGLADKKPGERKKFVVSIIESLEVYNGIHKTLTKRSSNYKSMINNVASKLGNLGDEQSIQATLQSIANRIEILGEEKDAIGEQIGMHKAKINSADPDGSMQNNFHRISIERDELEKESKSIISSLESMKRRYNIDIVSDKECFDKLEQINRDIIEEDTSVQILKNKISSALADRETESIELQKKTAKLQSLDNIGIYEDIVDKLTIYKAEKEEIQIILNSIGINDIISLSKDEYILALETLKDIKETIDTFKDFAGYTPIVTAVERVIGGLGVPNLSGMQGALAETERDIDERKTYLNNLYTIKESLKSLDLKPEDCNNVNCSFISEAIRLKGQHPNIDDEIENEEMVLKDFNLDKNACETAVKEMEEIIKCMNQMNVIIRSIDRNGAILSKIPNTKQYTDKVALFTRFLNGDTFDDINTLYSYIKYADMLEEYKQDVQLIMKLEADLEIFNGKNQILDEIQSDILSINYKLSTLTEQLTELGNKLTSSTAKITMLREQESQYRLIYDKLIESHSVDDNKAENEKALSLISINMGSIQQSKMMIDQLNERKASIMRELIPTQQDRDKYNHAITQIAEYQAELSTLNAEYEFTETIKFYSSPTTGIQLVFMQLYMGKIIELANELLKLLFNGRFLIQPFVINESEFRIPCTGNGYMNDDISSMSNAQISMISMILSFALLYHSSTKFNIIKLDEIDGALDETNRIMFIDVLSKIMDIMHTEQCVIISHNTELQVDSSDVILLRMDNNPSGDYIRGNIIWKYN